MLMEKQTNPEYHWDNNHNIDSCALLLVQSSSSESLLPKVINSFHVLTQPSVSLDIDELDTFGSTPSLKSYYAVTDEV